MDNIMSQIQPMSDEELKKLAEDYHPWWAPGLAGLIMLFFLVSVLFVVATVILSIVFLPFPISLIGLASMFIWEKAFSACIDKSDKLAAKQREAREELAQRQEHREYLEELQKQESGEVESPLVQLNKYSQELTPYTPYQSLTYYQQEQISALAHAIVNEMKRQRINDNDRNY